jgi:hypothetical protein
MKAQKKVSVPSLQERVEALLEELDAAIDELCEAQRPEGVPIGWIRQNFMVKALCPCRCQAYLQEMKKKEQ